MIVIYFIVAAALQVVRGDWNCQNSQNHPNWHLLDTREYCGLSPYDLPSPRLIKPIIGGQDARIAEFPWVAAIMALIQGSRPAFFCGGSVISQYYILTAAHCFYDDEEKDVFLFVRLGETSLRRDKFCVEGGCSDHAIDMEIWKPIPHPQYDPITRQSDIGLIRTKKMIPFSPFICPICLPTPCKFYKHHYHHDILRVAGWGRINTVGEPAYLDELQVVDVPVVPVTKCQNLVRKVKIWKMICAGVPQRKGTRSGDSGGPVMYKDTAYGSPARNFLVGVVSFGSNFKSFPNSIQPEVFTRVDYYLHWILDSVHD